MSWFLMSGERRAGREDGKEGRKRMGRKKGKNGKKKGIPLMGTTQRSE